MADSEKIKKINDIIINRDNLNKIAIKIEELPLDDEWLQDNVWDKVYEQENIKKIERR